MSIDAMKQALEYLDSPSSKLWPAGTQYKIITALRLAIEQAERVKRAEEAFAAASEGMKGEQAEKQEHHAAGCALLKIPSRDCDCQEMREPVAYVSGYYAGYCVIEPLNRAMVMPNGMALYTAPPQRQPLTEEEIEAVWKVAMFEDNGRHALLDNQPFVHFARAIERARGIGGE
jgi:hypothetical protein